MRFAGEGHDTLRPAVLLFSSVHQILVGFSFSNHRKHLENIQFSLLKVGQNNCVSRLDFRYHFDT